VSAICFSVLLLCIGFELAFHAVRSIASGVEHAPKAYALIVVLAAIAIKEGLYRYRLKSVQHLSGSSAGRTEWQQRRGVFSSIVACIGVGGAVLGKYLAMPQLYYLDP